MKQAIAGVAPPSLQEVSVMTVWPSVAASPVGRALGQLYANKTGLSVLTLGNLCCLLFIPVSLALYFARIAPFIGTRYKITNRRVLVLRGIAGREEKAVDFDRFDSIEIVVSPGQAWYDAGDLVFYQGKTETFRLVGVSRPQAFRATCMKSRNSHAGIKKWIA